MFFIYSLIYCQNEVVEISFEINSDEKIENIAFNSFRGVVDFNFKESKKINFENNISEEYFIIIKTLDNQYKKRLWLDSGSIRINLLIKNNELKMGISGSKLYSKVNKHQEIFKTLLEKKVSNKQINEFLFNELNDNLNNPYSFVIGLNILFKNQNNKPLLIELKNVLRSQNENTKNHYSAELLLKTLASRISTGEINISDFYFLDANNSKMQIVANESDFVLLDFWHTACPPCLKDHITLEEKKDLFFNKKIKLVSISNDQGDRITTWEKYLKTKKISWENYREMENNSLTNSLNIRIFPTYILLDKQNKIQIYTNSLKEVLIKIKEK